MNAEQAYINGFVKRAMEYGLNESETEAMFKKAFGEEDGPYRQEQAANLLADELMLKAFAHNKEKHKGHYYFNPFVGGPIRDGINRLSRRFHAGSADDSGGLINLLSSAVGLGGIPNMVRGDDDKKALARKIFEEHASKHSPE